MPDLEVLVRQLQEKVYGNLEPAVFTAVVTQLPADPYDGQVIDFLADAANGVVWRLKYRAASASAYKWEFVGGSAWTGFATGSVTIPNGTYALTTPSFTLPLAGDYLVQWRGQGNNGSTAAATFWLTQSGPTGGDGDALLQAVANGWSSVLVYDRILSGLSAGLALYPRSRGNASSMSIGQRTLIVTPIRVG